MGADSVVSSILDGFSLTRVSWDTILVAMALAFVIGLFIFFIYKKTFTGMVFTKSYGISLILLTLVTAALIMVISSNAILSIGMVGALSIVRFRTAIKDPMDTMYMFWAIAEGIIIGANYYIVALVSAVLIGIFMVVVSIFRMKKNMPYILVLRFEDTASCRRGI